MLRATFCQEIQWVIIFLSGWVWKHSFFLMGHAAASCIMSKCKTGGTQGHSVTYDECFQTPALRKSTDFFWQKVARNMSTVDFYDTNALQIERG